MDLVERGRVRRGDAGGELPDWLAVIGPPGHDCPVLERDPEARFARDHP